MLKRFLIAIGLLFLSCSVAEAQVPYPFTPTVSVGTSGVVLKAAPGSLVSAYVTTDATAGYLVVYNAVAIPVDGALTAALTLECVYVTGTTTKGLFFNPPQENYSAGIVMFFSSTGCDTKTALVVKYFHAQVN